MSNPRETIYDEKIYPLMAQIIELCKENKIPMVASFELDRQEGFEDNDPLMCSTVLLPEDFEIFGSIISKLGDVIMPHVPKTIADILS